MQRDSNSHYVECEALKIDHRTNKLARANSSKACHPTFTDKQVSRPTFPQVSLTKMVQWPILNNSHAYPFCKTTPGTTSYLDLAIAPFLSVKLMEIGRETIQSVKVRVHHLKLGKRLW